MNPHPQDTSGPRPPTTPCPRWRCGYAQRNELGEAAWSWRERLCRPELCLAVRGGGGWRAGCDGPGELVPERVYVVTHQQGAGSRVAVCWVPARQPQGSGSHSGQDRSILNSFRNELAHRLRATGTTSRLSTHQLIWAHLLAGPGTAAARLRVSFRSGQVQFELVPERVGAPPRCGRQDETSMGPARGQHGARGRHRIEKAATRSGMAAG